MFRRKRKPRASTKDCEAPVDLVRECVDYGRMEAIRIPEQNPGIDRDELTRQVIAKAMKRYQAVAPSDIGEADIDVACQAVYENIPEADQIRDVEYYGETEDGHPVYRVIYEYEIAEATTTQEDPEAAEEDPEADAIVRRWIDEDIPEEDRTVDVVFDPETGKSRIVYGIREL